MVDLDIILPLYNPKSGWEKDLLRSVESIHSLRPKLEFQIILVDDGSNKNFDSGTEQMLQQKIKNFRSIRHDKNIGKGAAVRTGATFATADVMIFTDADFPYAEKYLFEIYDCINSGKANIAIAVREQAYGSSVSNVRRLLSSLSKAVNKYLLNLRYSDSQAGLKGFDKIGVEALLATKINGFLFDLELLSAASFHSELHVAEVPVKLRDDVVLSKFNYKLLIEVRSFAAIAIDIFRKRLNYIFRQK